MKFLNFYLTTVLFAGLLTLSSPSNATIVLFKTSMGDFEVNLLDNDTPETVTNFLAYIEADAYSNSIVHRKVEQFIVQGGGFIYTDEVEESVTFDPVINEPVFSNVRGTIAMAKQPGKENSATNQWFFNVANNSVPLDNDNGGYTVFGVVIGNGMEIIDVINTLSIYNLGGAFGETPLQSEPAEGEFVTDEHLVMIESVTVVNNNKDTQPELPPKQEEPPVFLPTPEEKDSSGGSSGFLLLGALACIRVFRRN
ncbi:hypothetical protein A9Q98_05380 [Thalassotalea sp. 42_200_T64]|nr:hypothetical protein A9Q98_05380 [Thalassotalea sp. 42_200_T64]